MSLLEDIFLQDEGEEARELERIIEKEVIDERDSDGGRDNDGDEDERKSDEAEEDTRRVDPKKPKTVRVVKNPRVVLNPARLTGPRGIKVLPDHFKNFKFRGKGHELEDLDMVMKKLEHWAHRLYPKFAFEDCLKKIESLGKKREVAVQLRKIRSGQLDIDDVVVQRDDDDDDGDIPAAEPDDFDALLQQQIDLARADDREDCTHVASGFGPPERLLPKATSSPSISHEQKLRMIMNRRLAEEKRLARLRQKDSNTTESISRAAIPEEAEEPDPVETPKVIERSFENDDNTVVNLERVNNSNIQLDSDSDEDTSLLRHVNNHSPKIQEICPIGVSDQENIKMDVGSRRVCRKIIDDDDDDDVNDTSHKTKFKSNSNNCTDQNGEPVTSHVNENLTMEVDTVDIQKKVDNGGESTNTTNKKTGDSNFNKAMSNMTNVDHLKGDIAESSPGVMSSSNVEGNESNKENVTEAVKPTELGPASDISVNLEGMDAEMFEDF